MGEPRSDCDRHGSSPGTEPDVGCDLGAASARIERVEGRLLLTGTKMFITGATHGRLVKLLAKIDGRP